MQSYNLMKMSSEVTKAQGTPQFSSQDRQPDFYNKSPHMDFQNQQQVDYSSRSHLDFNRSMVQQQRPPQQFEEPSQDNFLGKVKTTYQIDTFYLIPEMFLFLFL